MILSKSEIRSRARAFAAEWAEEVSEDAEAKSFWDGFFNVFGLSRRRVASFEHGVKLSEGKQGFVDVFWKGVLLAEHKSRGKDLDKAYSQARDYFPGLKDTELPRYIIVSDFAQIRLYDLDEDTQTEFPLTDLHKHIDQFGFVSGHQVQVYEEQEVASIKAAQLMADFHNAIAKTGYSGHDLEVFMVRVLFCLFAENTDIFPRHHLLRYIENHTLEDGSDLGRKLLEIFDILSTPEEQRQSNLSEEMQAFPYVNGAIFNERLGFVTLDKEARDTLLKCCHFDWSGISAAIFGSLFQGVMDPDERRQLGAHYTSELNIMKVVQPLFLDDLYNEFDAAKRSPKKLQAFHDKLASLKFLDPACGCGNFLVTTYRELRRLEIEVLKKLRKVDTQTLTAFGAEKLSRIHVNQFYGIEIEEFPALVARTAMYLADHQANQDLSEEFGLSYARIPLEEPATIVHGNALTLDWAEIVPPSELDYILGNPPFYGARLMSKEQKADLIALFPKTLKGVGNLDFVTGWYAKSAAYIQDTQIKVGLVSTNSITQGEQVGILWQHLHDTFGVVRHFAHRTFKWKNEAKGNAAVYCVIIGFATHEPEKRYLYSYETVTSEPVEHEVENINAYLVDASEVFIQGRTRPICDVPEIGIGNKPIDGGYYLFTPAEKAEFLKKEPGAKKYFRRWLGSREFINSVERWCLWVGDADPSELKKLPHVLERIENVRQVRLSSSSTPTQKIASTPTRFHVENIPTEQYMVIPEVSSENREYIPMGLVQPEVLSSNLIKVIPHATLYHFGILTSKMHMTWVRYTCGRLESRYRYSKDIVYNNFPWPACAKGEEVSDDVKASIEQAAQAVLDARAQFPDSSLADLYDPRTMPPALQKAHTTLDRAVDKAYGYKDTNSDPDRIAFLFELYEQIVS